jgi:hemerythrin
MFKNININHKLALMITIPILGLLYFAIGNTLEKLEIVKEMNLLKELSEFAVQSSLLVHELQNERGMVAGFIGSQGHKFSSELEVQIFKTDNVTKKLKVFSLNSHSNNSDIQTNLETAFATLKIIEIKRNLIRNLNISLPEQLQYYTGIIDSLLITINYLFKKITNNELFNNAVAYVNFLQAKEKAGIERAILNNALSSENFAVDMYDKFVSLLKAQDIYFQNFLFFATPSQKQFYQKTMQSHFIEAVKQMRTVVLNKNSKIKLINNLGIEPTYWWKMATGRINLLKKVEDQISFDLKESAKVLKQEAQIIFMGYMITTGCIILFTFFYARIIFQETNQAYARFVPDEFLQLLNKKGILDIQLGDNVEMNLTVLFSDIRSFTTLSEKMSPQANFDFINAYLNDIGPIIRAHNGIVDKYIGDAVMALFVNAKDAINAGIAMREAHIYQGIEAGIGINTGKLMLGIIGEQNRLQCTVISDTVNVAARIETATKVYKTPLLVSQTTLNNLTDSVQYNLRFLDNIKVKGRSKLIKIFEVLNGEPQETQDSKLATIDIFERAVHLYQKNKFSEVQKLMQKCLQINATDTIAELYIRRCKNFLNINSHSEVWEDLANKASFTPDFLVHNKIIDEQHQELFLRMKNLLMAMGSNQPEEEINEVICFLKNYVITHFSIEEGYMRQYDYPYYTVHKAKHARFKENLKNIIEYHKINGSSLDLTLRIKCEILEWFIDHVIKMDKQLGLFLEDKQVDD